MYRGRYRCSYKTEIVAGRSGDDVAHDTKALVGPRSLCSRSRR